MNLMETTNYTDRDGIVDAVTRIVEGIDFANEDLLRSAFTEDAVFDLSGIDHSIHTFEPYVGRDLVGWATGSRPTWSATTTTCGWSAATRSVLAGR